MTFFSLYNLLRSLAKHELFFFFNDILLITEISTHTENWLSRQDSALLLSHHCDVVVIVWFLSSRKVNSKRGPCDVR